MARFMAVHTLPMNEEQLMAAMEEVAPKIPKGFTYKLTYCAFGDHKFFCEWDAPSRQSLEQAFKSLNMPFDAVYPVKLFDMATGKMT